MLAKLMQLFGCSQADNATAATKDKKIDDLKSLLEAMSLL